jgi:hypothetical protein
MNKVAKPRFNSAEAALRFYFRARSLLGAATDGEFQIPRLIPSCLPIGEGFFEDFLAVAFSLSQLDAFEIWLMCELYGPTGFRARQRTVEHALRMARARFPEHTLNRRELGRLRRGTVEMLRRRLALQGMIPAAGRATSRAPAGVGNHSGVSSGRAPMDQ